MIQFPGLNRIKVTWRRLENILFPFPNLRDGKFTQLAGPQEFVCKQLHAGSIPAGDKFELDKFNKNVAELTRLITGADAFRKELVGKINYLKKAVFETNKAPVEIYNQVLQVEIT